jgi:AcrR family transcriptional regulator
VSSTRSSYHHGDLKAALVDAAIELIAERGLRGFSLAELSRRLGVTVAAPYRHFADRDELLAAVAVRAVGAFGDALARGLAQAGPAAPPDQRLAAMAGSYVRFAAEQRPLFDVMYGAGLDKSRYPELGQVYQRVDEMLTTAVRQLCPDDPAAADALEDALEAAAHGYATLLLDGAYGEGARAVDQAAGQAARVARALIAGRDALRLRRGAAQLVQHLLPGLDGVDAQVAQGRGGELPARVTLGHLEQAQQQVLGAEVVMMHGPGLLDSQGQRLLGLAGQGHPPWAQQALRAGRNPLQGVRAEALGDPAPDLVQVDADRGQRFGILAGGAGAERIGLRRNTVQTALDRIRVHTQPGQGPGGHAVGDGQRVQQVHRADQVASLGGLSPGQEHDPPGVVGESLEHRQLLLTSAVAASAGHGTAEGPARVFLVDGLPGYPEQLRDFLPGPAVGPRVVHLEPLELLQQPA